MRKRNKKLTLRAAAVTAVGILLVVAMLAALLPNGGQAQAATPLGYIKEMLKSKAESNTGFKVLEITPQANCGVIGYYAEGQEPVSNWRTMLASKSRTERADTFNSGNNAALFGQLTSAGILSLGSGTPLTRHTTAYVEVLPWAYYRLDASSRLPYSQLNLTGGYESLRVSANFVEDSAGGPFERAATYPLISDVRSANGDYVQDITDFAFYDHTPTLVPPGSYYYGLEIGDGTTANQPISSGHEPKKGSAVFVQATGSYDFDGDGTPEQYTYYDCIGVVGNASFPGLEIGTNYYIINKVTAISDEWSLSTCYRAVTNGWREAYTYSDGTKEPGYFNCNVSHYTWVGYSRSGRPLGRYRATGEVSVISYDSASTAGIEVRYSTVYYTGGYSNNNWLLKYAMDASGAEIDAIDVSVTSLTPTQLNAMGTGSLAGYDLIVLTAGLDISAPNTPNGLLNSYNASNDLTQERAQAILTAASALNGRAAVPVILDWRLTRSSTNVGVLAKALVALKDELNDLESSSSPDLSSAAGSFLDITEPTKTSFVSGSLYCFNTASGLPSLVSGSTFHTYELDGHFDAAGFSKLSDEVSYENFLRRQQGLNDDLLDETVSPAAAVRFILNYAGRRIVNQKTPIKVLEVQPGTGKAVTPAKVREWFGLSNVSGSANYVPDSSMSITSMSTAEFIGKIDDLNEKYDVVYIGDSTTGFNVKEITDPDDSTKLITVTDYNDNDMDGLLYTNIGDIYRTTFRMTGLLDRDYSSSTFSDTYNGKNYIFNKIDTSTGTKANLARFSGNDITDAKVQELMDFATAGYPIILADGLISGTAEINRSYSFAVEIAAGESDHDSVDLIAGVTSSAPASLGISYAYRWYKDGVEVGGVQGASQTITAMTGHSYYCMVTANNTSYATSIKSARSATYSIGSSKAVSEKSGKASPGMYRDAGGGTATEAIVSSTIETDETNRTLTAAAISAPSGSSVRYQWQMSSDRNFSSPVNVTSGNRILNTSRIDQVSADGSTITLVKSDASNGYYRCIITVTYNGTDYSLTTQYVYKTGTWYFIYITVFSEPSGTATSARMMVTDGEPFSFTASAFSSHTSKITAGTQITLTADVQAGDGYPDAIAPSYQWYKNGTPIVGAIGSTHTFSTSASNLGDYYCQVTVRNGVASTNTLTLFNPERNYITVGNEGAKTGSYYKDNKNNPSLYVSLSSNIIGVQEDNATVTFSATVNAQSGQLFPSGRTLTATWYNGSTEVYSQTWTCIEVSSRTFSYSPTTEGKYTCKVIMSDLNGGHKSTAATSNSVTIGKTPDSKFAVSSGAAGTPGHGNNEPIGKFVANIGYTNTIGSTDVAMNVTMSPDISNLSEGMAYEYKWFRMLSGESAYTFTGDVSPSPVFTAPQTGSASYYCQVTMTGKGITSLAAAKTQVVTIKRTATATLGEPQEDGNFNYNRPSSQSPNTRRVDYNSKVYVALNSILPNTNVMTESQAKSAPSTALIYLNFSKPSISLSSMPTEYTTTTSQNADGRTLTYEFTIYNNTDATPSKTTYDVSLFIDINADGKYSANEELSDIVVRRLSGGTAAVYPNASGNYQLSAGVKYSVTRVMPADYVGILSWKLRVVKNGSPHIHNSVINYTRIAPQDNQKKTIQVLQILSDETNNLNLKTNGTYSSLISAVQDFNITISTVKASNLSNSSYWRDDTATFSSLAEYLDYYDMLVLGFSDVYKSLDDDAAKAILAFSENKSVLFTHDTTSSTNLPINGYLTTSGSVSSSYYWGYSFNSILRDAVSLDRYGVTSPTYGKTKYSPLNTTGISGPVAAGASRMTSAQVAALKADGYSVAYKPVSSASPTTPILIDETQGFTKFALIRYKGTSSSENYFFPTNHNNYQTGDANSSTTKVSQVNKGQITTYPYNLNTEGFGGYGSTISITSTHDQYYQLNMNSNDIVVWYCLADDGSSTADCYKNMPNDVVNAYYIYSVGNITYSGAGHSGNSVNEQEAKLFVNTMIAAYRTSAVNPIIEFTDAAGNRTENMLFSYDTNAQTTLDGVSVNSEDRAVFFKITDNNISSRGKSISVRIYLTGSEGVEKELESVSIYRGVENPLTAHATANGGLNGGTVYKFYLPDSIFEELKNSSTCTVRMSVTTTIAGKTYPSALEPPSDSKLTIRRFSLMELS